MDRAVRFTYDDRTRLAGVLASTADMEKQFGAPDHALKLLQLAQIGADESRDPQVGVVLHGLSASAYLALGHAEKAREQVRRSRGMFTDAEPDRSLPFFHGGRGWPWGLRAAERR